MPLEEIISEVKTREVTKRFTYNETEIKTLLGNKHNQADMSKVVVGSDGTGITVAVTITKTQVV